MAKGKKLEELPKSLFVKGAAPAVSLEIHLCMHALGGWVGGGGGHPFMRRSPIFVKGLCGGGEPRLVASCKQLAGRAALRCAAWVHGVHRTVPDRSSWSLPPPPLARRRCRPRRSASGWRQRRARCEGVHSGTACNQVLRSRQAGGSLARCAAATWHMPTRCIPLPPLRQVALLEAKAAKLCEMLSSVIEDTKGRIEKKQAQTCVWRQGGCCPGWHSTGGAARMAELLLRAVHHLELPSALPTTAPCLHMRPLPFLALAACRYEELMAEQEEAEAVSVRRRTLCMPAVCTSLAAPSHLGRRVGMPAGMPGVMPAHKCCPTCLHPAALLCLQEAAPADDSDEEDEFIYNPLKLPLGWDGKPIPYWLYKLHGLNLEFKCEICGALIKGGGGAAQGALGGQLWQQQKRRRQRRCATPARRADAGCCTEAGATPAALQRAGMRRCASPAAPPQPAARASRRLPGALPHLLSGLLTAVSPFPLHPQVGPPTGAAVPLSATSGSGATRTACARWASPTRRSVRHRVCSDSAQAVVHAHAWHFKLTRSVLSGQLFSERPSSRPPPSVAPWPLQEPISSGAPPLCRCSTLAQALAAPLAAGLLRGHLHRRRHGPVENDPAEGRRGRWERGGGGGGGRRGQRVQTQDVRRPAAARPGVSVQMLGRT